MPRAREPETHSMPCMCTQCLGGFLKMKFLKWWRGKVVAAGTVRCKLPHTGWGDCPVTNWGRGLRGTLPLHLIGRNSQKVSALVFLLYKVPV